MLNLEKRLWNSERLTQVMQAHTKMTCFQDKLHLGAKDLFNAVLVVMVMERFNHFQPLSTFNMSLEIHLGFHFVCFEVSTISEQCEAQVVARCGE